MNNLIASKDWFFSNIFREIAKNYFERLNRSLDDKLKQKFQVFDENEKFDSIEKKSSLIT